MNKLFLILIIGIFKSTLSTNNVISEFDITGKWKSKNSTEFGYFTFEKDGFALIETEDKVIGGKKFEQNGMTFSLEFKINYNSNPIELDLIFTELINNQKLIWPCLVKIIDKDEIILARGKDNKRPDNFDNFDSIVLKRIE